MTKFNPKKIILKDNSNVIIRLAKIQDAENLLKCIKTYISTSNYIPKFKHEITLTIDQEKDWIHSFLINDNSLLLVAEYENEIIGNIDLTGSRREAMKHTAVIGMGMIQDWQNKGLGTALLSSVIDWAEKNPILEIIWLQVYTENNLGLGLYKKLGFTESGILKNFFKHNNNYFDNLTMSKNVKNTVL